MTPGDIVVATERAAELHPPLAAFVFVVMYVEVDTVTVTPITHKRFVLLRVRETRRDYQGNVTKSFSARKNEFVGIEYKLPPELLIPQSEESTT